MARSRRSRNLAKEKDKTRRHQRLVRTLPSNQLNLTIPHSFLDDIDRVTSLRFLPSDDDVLKARLKTVGVSEYKFEIELGAGRDTGTEWRIVDVGGSRSQRRPFFHILSDPILISCISLASWVPFFDDGKIPLIRRNQLTFSPSSRRHHLPRSHLSIRPSPHRRPIDKPPRRLCPPLESRLFKQTTSQCRSHLILEQMRYFGEKIKRRSSVGLSPCFFLLPIGLYTCRMTKYVRNYGDRPNTLDSVCKCTSPPPLPLSLLTHSFPC